MNKIWFTADTHFGHNNILKYSKRPFASIEEHDRQLLQNWNDHVMPTDIVYHLGDVCFGNKVRYNLYALNGIKYIIIGNHDHHKLDIIKKNVTSIQDVKLIRIPDADCANKRMGGNQLIFLSHYAHRVWPHSHHGAFHLYGHSHGSLFNDIPLTMDVGVDSIAKWLGGKKEDYRPISYDEVKIYLQEENEKWLS